MLEVKAGQFIGVLSRRPSPPSSRPPRAVEAKPRAAQIDMQFGSDEGETERESETVVKKKRVVVSDETRTVAVARVDKLVEAGNPAGEAVASVAKEIGVSDSAVINWRTAARKNGGKVETKNRSKKPAKQAKKRSRIETQIAGHARKSAEEPGPLDIALDLLALATRAREKLGAASRKRLLAELTERLS